MGRMAFSGPVYGTKSLLFSARLEVGIVSTVTQTIGVMTLPAYQDFYFTELHLHRSSTGSTVLTAALSDDSSRATASTRTVATARITSSLADATGSTSPPADGAEYEGLQVAGGSTLTVQLIQNLSSAAALTSSGVDVHAYGFVRLRGDSSRAF